MAAPKKLTISPELAGLSVSEIARRTGYSTTAVLYAQRRAAGLCERCGSPAADGLCTDHRLKMLAYQRKRGGFNAWKPGSPGRPPRKGVAE